ncbi:AbrB/MazE/SpoVT family DNA-binding domain-containing protein [Candidatus Acetothermia bacterium]|nr:AbrB/MazE/SpoVT family DNA-binding domain-containing protein [Candidatus Acetothermia bacterium]MBI3660984.1 AbrB/MazE/SpoVT family DNA-binding domain-containing protein [Candidatus Acetothermia bacterium]
MEIVKLNERGQVTLPKEIRKKEGLKQGDALEVVYLDGVIALRKVGEQPHILNLFRELGKALIQAGYGSRQQIQALSDEIKEEVAAKWSRKPKRSRSRSS